MPAERKPRADPPEKFKDLHGEALSAGKQICGYRQFGASNLHSLCEGASLFAGGRASRRRILSGQTRGELPGRDIADRRRETQDG